MDLLEFCNSSTVRDYWKEISYTPNCYEAAWVVWDSFHKSVKEKLKAFDSILETYEDAPFYCFGEYHKSFFKELKGFKKAVQILKAQIANQTSTIFTVEEHYRAYNGDYTHSNIDKIFNSYDKLISYLREECCEDTLYYEVRCNYVDCDSCLYFTLNNKLDLIFINDYNNMDLLLFEGICIKFPLPFKKGDIIQSKNYFCQYNSKFVLDFIETAEKGADSSDMIAAGYWLSDKDFYQDHTLGHNLDLEIVNPAELSKKEARLYIIRDYLLKRIGLEVFYGRMSNFFAEMSKKGVGLSSEELDLLLKYTLA